MGSPGGGLFLGKILGESSTSHVQKRFQVNMIIKKEMN